MSSPTTSTTTPPAWKLYALPSIALIVCMVALSMAVVAQLSYHSAKNESSGSAVVNSVVSTNGFAGTVSNGALSLETTPSGLLQASSGTLTEATGQQVTSTLLTGFQPIQLASNQITSSDTILTGLEKCVVLKQTLLAGVSSTSGDISETDTVLSCFGKLQYQQNRNNIYLFGIAQSVSVASTSLSLLWAPPNQGSKTLPAGFLQAGIAVNTQSIGLISIGGLASTFLLQFTAGSTGFVQLSSTALAGGTYGISCQTSIFGSTNTSALLKMIIRIYGSGSSPLTIMGSQTFSYTATDTQLLSLSGLVSPTFGSSAALTINNSFGWVGFNGT